MSIHDMGPYRKRAELVQVPQALRAFTRRCPVCGHGPSDYQPPLVTSRCPWRCGVPGPHAHGKCQSCDALWVMMTFEDSQGAKP